MDDTKYSHPQLRASLAALRVVLLAVLQDERKVRKEERTGYCSVCVRGRPRLRSVEDRPSALTIVVFCRPEVPLSDWHRRYSGLSSFMLPTGLRLLGVIPSSSILVASVLCTAARSAAVRPDVPW